MTLARPFTAGIVRINENEMNDRKLLLVLLLNIFTFPFLIKSLLKSFIMRKANAKETQIRIISHNMIYSEHL